MQRDCRAVERGATGARNRGGKTLLNIKPATLRIIYTRILTFARLRYGKLKHAREKFTRESSSPRITLDFRHETITIYRDYADDSN